MKQTNCETCRWRESEIGYPSPCPSCQKEIPFIKDCSRCNGNGCPACDGTKGSEYNPEPY